MCIPIQLKDFFFKEMERALFEITGRADLELKDLPRENVCDPVSNEFAITLEHEFDYTVESPVRAPVNGAKHFVAVVKEHPEFEISTPVLVDGTIKQFNEDYPEIVIEPINSKFVEETYDYIELEYQNVESNRVV